VFTEAPAVTGTAVCSGAADGAWARTPSCRASVATDNTVGVTEPGASALPFWAVALTDSASGTGLGAFLMAGAAAAGIVPALAGEAAAAAICFSA